MSLSQAVDIKTQFNVNTVGNSVLVNNHSVSVCVSSLRTTNTHTHTHAHTHTHTHTHTSTMQHGQQDHGSDEQN